MVYFSVTIKTNNMKQIAFYISILLLTVVSSCSSDDSVTDQQQIKLSQTEIDDLKILREEEKLARDVYLYSFDKYGENIFKNISQSEQKHMDKILVLLNTYQLDDPALSIRGEFTSQVLQKLYNDLTKQSDISYLEALKVGATIEDLDINDIDDFEKRTTRADILDAYDKLKCGSRNHMRSYYSQLISNGTTYESQFISLSELTDIINSQNEKCGK